MSTVNTIGMESKELVQYCTLQLVACNLNKVWRNVIMEAAIQGLMTSQKKAKSV